MLFFVWPANGFSVLNHSKLTFSRGAESNRANMHQHFGHVLWVDVDMYVYIHIYI